MSLATSMQIYSAPSQSETSKHIKRPDSSSTLSTFLIPSSGVLECRPLSTPVSHTNGLCSSAFNGCFSTCCFTSSADFMGQGYEHPGPGHHPLTRSTYFSQTVTPRSGIAEPVPVIHNSCIAPHSGISNSCIDHTFINVFDKRDPSTFSVAETQLILDGC